MAERRFGRFLRRAGRAITGKSRREEIKREKKKALGELHQAEAEAERETISEMIGRGIAGSPTAGRTLASQQKKFGEAKREVGKQAKGQKRALKWEFLTEGALIAGQKRPETRAGMKKARQMVAQTTSMSGKG
ncbi:MAG: hypothetical protein QME51_04225 [Planctomycetota bacterium]|nr:hypothetical protein [Planctomycetota bacterium]